MHISLALVALTLAANAQTNPDPRLLQRWQWRNVGPATTGGRIADIAGFAGEPNLIYLATGSAGLFKSTNGGTTWRAIFERQGTISIGAIAVDSRNPDIVWIGTGEANLRNSVSFGDGVYRSNDGGRTWRNMGLRDTQTISRIVAHPTNPDICYVAAVGHTFGPNTERGIFATFDGGKTWQKTLYVDDAHGAADIDIDPSNPNILFAAMWHFDRKPWTFESGSEKGGVFRSEDAGRTWTRITQGLPKLAGRIGVKIAPSNPKVVYVIAESSSGTFFRSEDGGKSFLTLADSRELVGRGYYYADLRVDPTDENRVYVLTNGLMLSTDGGRTFRRISPRTHGDYHALWIHPRDPKLIWQGQDGGMAVSRDRGETWEQIANIPLGQFYRIYADDRAPFYELTGGMQDNGSWTGPSRNREPLGILNDDWRMLNGATGFAALSDPDDPDMLLTEQSGGVLLRTNLRTREQQLVGPQIRGNAGGNASGLRYRFNWDAPLVKSPHGKNTIYLAGNVLFQSTDLGKSWEPVSRDLTNNDPAKMRDAGGPVWIENGTDVVYGTITGVSESPAARGTIWTVTDDGNIQVTTNGGSVWTNVAKNLTGVPAGSPVSHVEASRRDSRTAYVALNRHMLDDFRPYIFKTTDGGSRWSSLAGNLPANAYVWVLREDPRNPNLLYAGTELGIFASWTGGTSWVPLTLANLPGPIAVRDIVIHPRDNDLIVATHGRGIWILDDISALQQFGAGETKLLPLRTTYRHAVRPTRLGIGDKAFAAPNPPYGALITYWLQTPSVVRLQILDAKGAPVRELRNLPVEVGWNRVAWDLRVDPPAGAEREDRDAAGGPRGPQALPGAYKVRVTANGRVFEQPLNLRMDPAGGVSDAELSLQFEMIRKTQALQVRVSAAVRRLNSAAEKLSDNREQMGRIEALSDPLVRPRRIARTATGPRLTEHLETLFNALDGPNAAPTGPMLRLYEELEADANRLLPAVDEFLKTVR